MKRLKKHLILLISISILYILTLGIHFEHGVNSRFRYPEGNPWNQFVNGSSVFYANTWLGGGHISEIGIPYLFYIIRDKPPYSLSFCFTANTDKAYKTITIDSLHIKYDKERESIYKPTDDIKTLPFTLDERGKERNETPYYRANYSFSDIIEYRSSFLLTINGSYTINNNEYRYEQKVYVEYFQDSYTYIGWVALGLRGL